jgi:chemotaxis response regulator CheB
LLDPPPILSVDILICRNTLIYFTTEARQRVLQAMSHALIPGGVLILGPGDDASCVPGLELWEANAPFIFRKVAKAESHLCSYPTARDHVTLPGTVTRGDCQPLMLRLASLLKRLLQSNKPADAYSDCVDPATLAPEKTGEPARISAGETEVELLVIGVSTGGPDVLAEIFRHLQLLRVPMLIALHMPADHTASFAAHLAREFKIPVVECGDGPIPPVGSVGLLKGGRDFVVKRFQDCLTLRSIEASGSNAHPNIDTLLRSAAKAGIKALPIILTGMGRDGASGSKLLEDQGMPVWVQTPASCTVAGMPLATLEEVSHCAVLAPDAIARRLNNLYGFAETKYSVREQSRL